MIALITTEETANINRGLTFPAFRNKQLAVDNVILISSKNSSLFYNCRFFLAMD